MRLLGALLVVGWLSAQARAATGQIDEVSEEASLTTAQGETMSPNAGMKLLVVRVSFMGEGEIDSSQVRLVLPDGKELPAALSAARANAVSLCRDWLSAAYSSKTPSPAHLCYAFAIPNATARNKLKLQSLKLARK